jgi:hypothetical protein
VEDENEINQKGNLLKEEKLKQKDIQKEKQ